MLLSRIDRFDDILFPDAREHIDMTDALCFDLFGTLCDVSTVREVFSETVDARTDRSAEDAADVYDCWQDTYSAYTRHTAAMGTSVTHREIMERSLTYALELHGLDLERDDRRTLVDARSDIETYPGAHDALATFREEGFELAVLSNGDPDLLGEIADNTGIDRHLDRVISAGDSGVFKPAPESYRHAADVLDRPIGTCWLVSAHSWDARGAAQAGMLGAWINRDDRPDDLIGRRPALRVDSFEELPRRL